MDLSAVSNPTGTSRPTRMSGMNPLASSNAGSTLRDRAGFGGAARNTSLANEKLQPRFNEILDRFGDATLVPGDELGGNAVGGDAMEFRFHAVGERPDDIRGDLSDSLEIDSNSARPPRPIDVSKVGETSELKEKFTEFVGQTLFGSMLASMRKTLGKPAYMHGGRTEEVFQQQLDQVIVEDLTEASADSIASPMFDLFKMQKRS